MSINIDINKDISKLKSLEAGTSLVLNGIILTARDAAHKKMKNIIDSGNKLPVDLYNNIIYYMGPTPTRPGYPIGSCGPTSSYRMDNFLEMTLKLGIAATIGKGERSPETNGLIKKYKAPYLVTIGGAAAYLAECITSCEIILFEELGAEAVRKLTVKNFPAITAIDCMGNSIFKSR